LARSPSYPGCACLLGGWLLWGSVLIPRRPVALMLLGHPARCWQVPTFRIGEENPCGRDAPRVRWHDRMRRILLRSREQPTRWPTIPSAALAPRKPCRSGGHRPPSRPYARPRRPLGRYLNRRVIQGFAILHRIGRCPVWWTASRLSLELLRLGPCPLFFFSPRRMLLRGPAQGRIPLMPQPFGFRATSRARVWKTSTKKPLP